MEYHFDSLLTPERCGVVGSGAVCEYFDLDQLVGLFQNVHCSDCEVGLQNDVKLDRRWRVGHVIGAY
ncbi:hypothetical protein DN585_03770 [Intrasporangium calvum]|nr:hypothetical protein DN585_03770 [Intrasporangium calvum]